MESAEDDFQHEIKEKLRSRIFLGSFGEKIYVPAIKQYRNLILLSNSENDFLMDLSEVKRRIKRFYRQSSLFIGFETENDILPSSGSLYVDELDDVPFGHFWFQVKTVKFRDGEVKLKLKALRKVDIMQFIPADCSTKSLDSTHESIEWKEIVHFWFECILINFKEFMYEKVNKENMRNFFHLLSLLTISLVVSSFQIIKNVGDFSIRFMAEISRLVHVCTPICFGILDLISRIVGGFFIFLSMLWKDSIGSAKKQPAIGYPSTRT